MKVIIRKPGAADEAAVRGVSEAAAESLRRVYQPTGAALELKAARRAHRNRLVCEVDGRIAGTIEYEERQECLHLMGPMVHPDYQRRGVAKCLVEHLCAFARDRGLSALSLYTIRQTGNVPIFQRLGFEVIHEDPALPSSLVSVTGAPLTEVHMERRVR